MNGKKEALALLLVLAIAIGGMAMAGGYPDWAYVVFPFEGAVFNIQGQVDANITNTEINVNVTNSELVIRPAEDVTFTIEPAAGVTFNIEGNVDATIVGTASVSIDRATITVDVATIKERASEAGKVHTANTFISASAGGAGSKTMLETATTDPLYVEMFTASVVDANGVTADGMAKIWFEIVAYDEYDTPLWRIYAHLSQFPINLDPAFRIPKDGYLVVSVHNRDSVDHTIGFSVIFRY